MLRLPAKERVDLLQLAEQYGFDFHTMYGEKYWDESRYYQFSLAQVENDIEDPTAELHQMCLKVVDKVINSDELLAKFQIPKPFFSFVRQSWQDQEPSLYSRMDLVYDGAGPAKLLENNADTPTSVYETGFWQWLWLEHATASGKTRRTADQYNSLQDKLISRFQELKYYHPDKVLYFACAKNTIEDRGTVQYMEDCAREAGIDTAFVYVEDIGIDAEGRFTANPESDTLPEQSPVIDWIFKLYPWEDMMREDFAPYLLQNNTYWLEPAWKSILSNKALLPMLWQMFPGHPNLLEAYFEEDAENCSPDLTWVRKPIFSREGANIQIIKGDQLIEESDGDYANQGHILQAFSALPKFGDSYTLIGSWLVNDQPAGMSIREDASLITKDMSRYIPHLIV